MSVEMRNLKMSELGMKEQKDSGIVNNSCEFEE
jgi:hypothetical protein